MTKQYNSIFALALIFLGMQCWQVGAASIYKQSLSQKSNRYANEGVFTGGKAGRAQALMKVRRVNSTKVGMERIILDLGDEVGKPIIQSGYFHVSVDPKNSRVVIQLNEMRQAKVTEQTLRRLFAKSTVVKGVDFTVDPEDSTGTIVLKLKMPVNAEVFELSGKKSITSRLILDLKENRAKVTQANSSQAKRDQAEIGANAKKAPQLNKVAKSNGKTNTKVNTKTKSNAKASLKQTL